MSKKRFMSSRRGLMVIKRFMSSRQGLMVIKRFMSSRRGLMVIKRSSISFLLILQKHPINSVLIL
jgi:hypothetical protein